MSGRLENEVKLRRFVEWTGAPMVPNTTTHHPRRCVRIALQAVVPSQLTHCVPDLETHLCYTILTDTLSWVPSLARRSSARLLQPAQWPSTT